MSTAPLVAVTGSRFVEPLRNSGMCLAEVVLGLWGRHHATVVDSHLVVWFGGGGG